MVESIPRERIEKMVEFLESESQAFLKAADVKPSTTPNDITPIQMGYIHSASAYLVAAGRLKLALKGK